MTFCQQCRTQPATTPQDSPVLCADCCNEKPLHRPLRWDEVMNPSYIIELEGRIGVLELQVAKLEKLMAGMEADS